MEFAAYSTPPDNSSAPSSSSPHALCTTAATYVFLPCAYALLFLTALPGNVLSLWVFQRCISTMSSTHVYLSHLSISNLLLSVTTPFLAAYYAQSSVWTLDSVLCQLVVHGITPVLHINIYIGLMILTWVALSRFASLIQHTHASRPSACVRLLPHGFFTRLKKASFASRVCVAVWMVAVGGIVPVTVYYSVNEAMKGKAKGEDGEDATRRMCYSPAVETGGTLSAAFSVPLMILFFVFYLLVLLSYVIVLKHIRRSRRSAIVTTSHSLLGKVFRNIVIIQVVLSVCLLPYHVFKPIFISSAHPRLELTNASGPDTYADCHPLSTFVEVKNCLYLLAALRGSTDPVMYFLLDNTFRQQLFTLLGRKQDTVQDRPMFWSVTGSGGQRSGQQQDRNVSTGNLSHDRDL